MSGVTCDEGVNSFLECETMHRNDFEENFIQKKVIDVQDFGCKAGLRTNIAGVICGNRNQLEFLRKNASNANIKNIIQITKIEAKVQEASFTGKLHFRPQFRQQTKFVVDCFG